MANESAPAVHSMHLVRFEVPELEEAERFYTAFGLDVRRDEEGLSLRTFGSDHVWAVAMRGACKRLVSLTLGIYDRDREAMSRRVEERRIAPPFADASDAVWFMGPDGVPIALVVADKSSPEDKARSTPEPFYEDRRGTGPRRRLGGVRPRRLAHVALFTSDVQRSIEFFGDILGLRLSDRSGDEVAFMHGPHGSDHHLVAFARSTGPGLHHLSWDVASIGDIGLGAAQMAAAGYAAGWGLGRHVLGSNYFHYVRDPWGSYSEYSADMDFIPAGSAWPAADHPAEDSFYQWGPEPPADFGHNYEVEESGENTALATA